MTTTMKAVAPRRRAARITGLLAIGLFAAAAIAGPPFAKHAESGKSLVVPQEHARLGAVYHALPGRSPQIHVESDAPLEKIKGQSNQVVGYAVAGPTGNEARLQAGEWHLPVASIRTGIELRDEHLQSGMWLDAENHPNIVFQLQRVRDVRQTRSGSGFRSYTATLEGEMTMHGVTRKKTIPGATLTFLDAGPRSESIAKGNLLAIRAKYTISLRDYDVSHKTIGNKVSEEVEIDTKLYLSTVPPEQQPKG